MAGTFNSTQRDSKNIKNIKRKTMSDSAHDHVLQIFEESGALLKGHFKLTSGLHSGSYFQCALVLQYPQHSQLLAQKIVTNFLNKKIEVVISPAIGGIVVGQEVGRQLGVRTIFTERKNGKMELRRGFNLRPGEKVLICEDVVTTGGSVFEVMDVVRDQGAEIAGVACIVDRSDGAVDFSVDQFAVIRMPAIAYEEDQCPMCQAGLPIQTPGSRPS